MLGARRAGLRGEAARLPAVDDDDDDGEVLKVSGRLLNILPLWVFFVYTTFHLPRL